MNINVVWAAGLIEGEGTFQWRKSQSPRVSCAMTDLDVLERLRDNFGGNICKTTKQQEHHKQAWVWYLGGEAAIEFMKQVQPWMGKRRSAKIDEVVSLWNTRQNELAEKRKVIVDKATAAAVEYVNGGGSLRQVAAKHGVSYVTVKNYAALIPQ
jgi:hypothetical protein